MERTNRHHWYDHVSINTNLFENRSEQSNNVLDEARVELQGLTKGFAKVKVNAEEKGISITDTSRRLQSRIRDQGRNY